jgi:hypothetical protein
MNTKGKFSTSKKFLGFVRQRRGGTVDHPGKTASVDGKIFSHPGKTFELTVHGDGTVDLTHTGPEPFSEDQLSSFLQILDDLQPSPTINHWVLTGVQFADPAGKADKLYLSVEVASPYKRLQDIFEEPEIEVSDQQATRLAAILGELSDVADDTPEPEVAEPRPDLVVEVGTPPTDLLESAFQKMREEKTEELKSSLERANDRIKKHKREIAAAESMLKAAQAEADLLGERVRAMGVKPTPNGILFHVSERTNDKISLDEATTAIIRDAISKVKSINAEAFMKLFTVGDYKVTLYTRSEHGDLSVLAKSSALPDGLDEVSLLLIASLSHDGETFVFSGDKDWHQVVDLFVSSGFEHLSTKPDELKKTK